MNISEIGKQLIKSFEGLRYVAYKSLPTEKYYTIGYGHYGSDITKDMIITLQKANELFDSDIQKYVNAVNNASLGFTPNQYQFDSLVSFCYNLGVGIMSDFKGKSSKTVAQEMLLYVNSGGNKIQGLVNRRNKEVELFNTTVSAAEYIVKEYSEKGTFYPNQTIGFINYPMGDEIVGQYFNGELVHYDRVIHTNKFVYISWYSVLGKRRMMAIRKIINGKFEPIWGRIV